MNSATVMGPRARIRSMMRSRADIRERLRVPGSGLPASMAGAEPRTRSLELEPVVGSRLFLWNDQERLIPAPQNQERGAAAGAHLVQFRARLRRVRDRLAIDLQDDVALVEPGARGRAARIDVEDRGPADGVVKMQLALELRRD